MAALLVTAAALLWYRPPSTSAPGEAARPPGTPGDTGPSHPTGPPPAPTRSVRDEAERRGQDAGAPGQGRSAVPAGMVGVPIRLAEPTALRLVRAGDRVDLVRMTEHPQPIATAALVLGVTGMDDPATGGLLLALTPAEAQRTVTGAEHGYAVLIRPDG